MQSSSRGSAAGRQAPGPGQQPQSPGPMRPFTPPDLSSIPHMDEASQQLGDRSHNGETTTQIEQPTSGPYIVGSPIDLGAIDNVDSINLRLGPLQRRSTKRKNRTAEQQHIELQESINDQSPTSCTGLPSGDFYDAIYNDLMVAFFVCLSVMLIRKFLAIVTLMVGKLLCLYWTEISIIFFRLPQLFLQFNNSLVKRSARNLIFEPCNIAHIHIELENLKTSAFTQTIRTRLL